MTTARAPANQLALAEGLARTAHAYQKEVLTGDPYVLHLERVVALVHSEDEKAVAWLHDIIEDADVTVADLEAAGVDPAIIKAVVLSTHGDEPYADYIATIIDSGDALAIAVKKADILDHMRPMTWALPDRLLAKYIPAMQALGLTRT
jgi:(p)ppGpp synthase/HD superfamily hydrolase